MFGWHLEYLMHMFVQTSGTVNDVDVNQKLLVVTCQIINEKGCFKIPVVHATIGFLTYIRTYTRIVIFVLNMWQGKDNKYSKIELK